MTIMMMNKIMEMKMTPSTMITRLIIRKIPSTNKIQTVNEPHLLKNAARNLLIVHNHSLNSTILKKKI